MAFIGLKCKKITKIDVSLFCEFKWSNLNHRTDSQLNNRNEFFVYNNHNIRTANGSQSTGPILF